MHWVTWKPLKGIRRQLWAQWLLGNTAQTGCQYPRMVTKMTCTLCGLKHPGLVQARLLHCPAWRNHFKKEYCAAWGEWRPLAQSWWNEASEYDLNHAARLFTQAHLVSKCSPIGTAPPMGVQSGRILVCGTHCGAIVAGKSTHPRCGCSWIGATAQTTTHTGFPVRNSPTKAGGRAKDK